MSLDAADRLWAVLWASGDPVRQEDLVAWLGVTMTELAAVEGRLEDRLSQTPFELRRIAGGLTVASRQETTRFLDEISGRRGPEPLSHAAWETLAVVAWRQPITRLEIDALRQVGSDHAIDTLLARGLVEQVGRRETVGRPILYATTPEFLRQFGLTTLDDLPPGPETEASDDPTEPASPTGGGGPPKDTRPA
jgi:segregation and condensation protein B